MDETAFQRGVREANADIASGTPRLYFQTRGQWGDLFTQLMIERFGVEVVHISDMTNDGKNSYEAGYNGTIKSHLESKFGAGSYERTWAEIKEFRDESYRRYVAETARKQDERQT